MTVTAAHGKNATLYMGTMPLTPYFRSVKTAASQDMSEASTFGGFDKTYVSGMGDATLSSDGIYDTSHVGAERDLQESLGSLTNQTISVYHAGDAIGMPGAGMMTATTSVEITADLGDIVTVSAEAQSSLGYERLISQAGFGTRSAGGTLTSIDNTGSTIYGGAGYLHVSALSGTMVIRIEDSSDDITYGTLVNFGTVTGPIGTRIACAGTVKRYTRLVHSTPVSGTAAFVCGLARKRR